MLAYSKEKDSPDLFFIIELLLQFLYIKIKEG